MSKTEQRARRLARLRAAGRIPAAPPRPPSVRTCAVDGCSTDVLIASHRWCDAHQGPGRRERKGRDR